MKTQETVHQEMILKNNLQHSILVVCVYMALCTRRPPTVCTFSGYP